MTSCRLDQSSYISYLVDEAIKNADEVDGSSQPELVSDCPIISQQVSQHCQNNSVEYHDVPVTGVSTCSPHLNVTSHYQAFQDFPGLQEPVEQQSVNQYPQPQPNVGLLPYIPAQNIGPVLCPHTTPYSTPNSSLPLYVPSFVGNQPAILSDQQFEISSGLQNRQFPVSESFRLNQPIRYSSQVPLSKFQLNNTIQVQCHFDDNDRFSVQARSDNYTGTGPAEICEESNIYDLAAPVDLNPLDSVPNGEFESESYIDYSQFNVSNFLNLNNNVYSSNADLHKPVAKRKYKKKDSVKGKTNTALTTDKKKAVVIPPEKADTDIEEEHPMKDHHAESRQYYRLFLENLSVLSKSKPEETDKSLSKDLKFAECDTSHGNKNLYHRPVVGNKDIHTNVDLESYYVKTKREDNCKGHHADSREYYRLYLESLKKQKSVPKVRCSSKSKHKLAMEEKTPSECSDIDMLDMLFECGVCSKEFVSSEELEDHIKCHDSSMNSNISLLCGVCGQEFDDLDYFEKHLESHKDEVSNELLTNKDYHKESREYFQKHKVLVEKSNAIKRKKQSEMAAKNNLNQADGNINASKSEMFHTDKRSKSSRSVPKRTKNKEAEECAVKQNENSDVPVVLKERRTSQAKNSLMNPSKGKRRKISTGNVLHEEDDELLKKFGIKQTKICLSRVNNSGNEEVPNLYGNVRSPKKKKDKGTNQIKSTSTSEGNMDKESKITTKTDNTGKIKKKCTKASLFSIETDNESDVEIIESPVELVEIMDEDESLVRKGDFENVVSPLNEHFESDFQTEIDLQTKFGKNEDDSALLKRFGIRDIAIKLDKVEDPKKVNNDSGNSSKVKDTSDMELKKKYGLKDVGIMLDKILSLSNTAEKKTNNSSQKSYSPPFNRRHYMKASSASQDLKSVTTNLDFNASNNSNKMFDQMSPTDLDDLLKQCGMGITVPASSSVSDTDKKEICGVKIKATPKRSPQKMKNNSIPIAKKKNIGQQPSSPQPSTSKGYSGLMKRTARKTVRDQELINKYQLKETKIMVKSLSKNEISMSKNPNSPFGKTNWLKHKFDSETKTDVEWDIATLPLLVKPDDDSHGIVKGTKAKDLLLSGNTKDNDKGEMEQRTKSKKLKGSKSYDSAIRLKDNGESDADLMKKFGIFESKVLVGGDVNTEHKKEITDTELMRQFGLTDVRVEVESPRKEIFARLKAPTKKLSFNYHTHDKNQECDSNLLDKTDVDLKQGSTSNIQCLFPRSRRSCKAVKKCQIKVNHVSTSERISGNVKAPGKRKTAMEKLKAKSISRAIVTRNRNRNHLRKMPIRMRKQVDEIDEGAIVVVDNLTDSDVASMKKKLKGIPSLKHQKLIRKQTSKKMIIRNLSKKTQSQVGSDDCIKLKHQVNKKRGKIQPNKYVSCELDSSKYADILKQSQGLKIKVSCLTDYDIAKLSRHVSSSDKRTINDDPNSECVSKESISEDDFKLQVAGINISSAKSDKGNEESEAVTKAMSPEKTEGGTSIEVSGEVDDNENSQFKKMAEGMETRQDFEEINEIIDKESQESEANEMIISDKLEEGISCIPNKTERESTPIKSDTIVPEKHINTDKENATIQISQHTDIDKYGEMKKQNYLNEIEDNSDCLSKHIDEMEENLDEVDNNDRNTIEETKDSNENKGVLEEKSLLKDIMVKDNNDMTENILIEKNCCKEYIEETASEVELKTVNKKLVVIDSTSDTVIGDVCDVNYFNVDKIRSGFDEGKADSIDLYPENDVVQENSVTNIKGSVAIDKHIECVNEGESEKEI